MKITYFTSGLAKTWRMSISVVELSLLLHLIYGIPVNLSYLITDSIPRHHLHWQCLSVVDENRDITHILAGSFGLKGFEAKRVATSVMSYVVVAI
ncbi:MAG: hypothetical protein WAM14_02020 [Candidatus Nitrosopolaris sp.]